MKTTTVERSAPEDRRILIVDDEDFVCAVFQEQLGEHYECFTAANAQEALQCMAERPFALVITDVQMPGLSGIDLMRKILEDFPDVAVIICSVVDRSQRVIDALRLGASDYLIKPCDLDVLELSVERALERRVLLRDGKRYKRDLERRNKELASQKAELERLQAQLVHNEKMASLGQLAGGVAHELNNPAGFLYSNMECLAGYADGIGQLLVLYDQAELSSDLTARTKELKEKIHYQTILSELSSIIADCHEGAHRIREIVLNLRTFSRLDEAEIKKTDIHEGIESTIRLLSQYYNHDRIVLKRDYGNLPPVECNAGQLNQVWMNLLTNAAQSLGNEPGEVRVKTGVAGEMIVVTISDTGKGIATENLKKIFDPFFTTKPIGEGTGLGLSISYGIIESHGGTIEVESTPGQGTTFTTMIPMSGTECIKQHANDLRLPSGELHVLQNLNR